jgi:Fuc2NAc and GlcNAc transferase
VEPHRRHIYQILANEAGIRHWKIALGYGLCQLIIGVVAMLIQPGGVWYLLVMYGVVALMFTGAAMAVRQRWAVR